MRLFAFWYKIMVTMFPGRHKTTQTTKAWSANIVDFWTLKQVDICCDDGLEVLLSFSFDFTQKQQ